MKLNIHIKIAVLFTGNLLNTYCGNNDYSMKSEVQKQNDSIHEKVSSEKNKNIVLPLDNSATKTINNMQLCYTNEVTAAAKYKDFSSNAELEGLHKIALLYKAASCSKNIMANNHKLVLIEAGSVIPKTKVEFDINTTKNNLANDIKNYTNGAHLRDNEFIKVAQHSGNQMAIVSLTYAMKTNTKYNNFYSKALNLLNKKQEKTLPSVYYVCSTCGNTFENITPDYCPFSMTKADKFIKINNLK